MQALSEDIIDSIFMYVPIGSIIDESTTKEEIENMLNEKVEDYRRHKVEPFRYIWSSVKNNLMGDYIVRFTICCNEYITEILMLDAGYYEEKIWKLEDYIKKRNVLEFPGHRYNWMYEISYKDSDILIKGLTKSLRLPVDEFVDFMNGSRNTRIEGKLTRVRFLDYDIIETFRLFPDSYKYLLALLEGLYNEGYWTFGGFKNFVSSDAKVQDVSPVSYIRTSDFTTHRFTISRDGDVIGKDLPKGLENALLRLGAHINEQK